VLCSDAIASTNPLLADGGAAWDWLIDSVGAASMLVAIEARMGPELRARYAVEDVWQETLLHAWRDRAKCEWQGVRAFRRWLLRVAEHRIRNLADLESTQKRGGAARKLSLSPPSSDGADRGGHLSAAAPSEFAGPVATTTPSRAASDAEQARAMRAALDRVPEDLRTVVHLHLFDELSFEELAVRLGISVSMAFRRFRRGLELYAAELEQQRIADRDRAARSHP
jgi:RNA polymerase sigma factor (sigma-70 family)